MLDLIFGPPKRRADSASGSSWDWWGGGQSWVSGRVRTMANVVVNEDLAMTYAACWCATRIIAETAASLPLITYLQESNGDRERASEHGLYDILKTAPNPQMGSMAFREGRTNHQVNWGNGFAEIEKNANGDVVNLWPIHPARVRPTRPGDRLVNGQPMYPKYPYRVRNNDGSEIALRADEMFHVPGVLSEDGIWGKGVIAYARESVGFGLATERHGATYFGSGAQPRIAVFGAGLKDSEARKNFRSDWKSIHGSPDSGEIAILPTDAKIQQLTIPPEDSQFLETRIHNVREVGRWYRIPVHMLGDLDKASYNSLEQLSLEFVIYSLLPWLRRWEEQIALKLIRRNERGKVFAEHLLGGLMRGDMASRYAAYNVALNNGLLSINEARRLENMNGIGPAGDKHRMPLNMTTVEDAGLMALPKSASVPAEPPGGEKPAAAKPTQQGQMPDELLDVPNVRQIHDFDCGAACTKAVAMFFEVDDGKTEEDFIEELGTKQTTPMENDGTHPASIIAWFTEQGMTVTSGSGWSLDDLRAFWAAGQPVIVPIQDYFTDEEEERENQSGHYVVVVGLWGGMVFVQDPSSSNAEAGGRTEEPDSVQAFGVVPILEERFLEVWHDMEDEDKIDVRYGIAIGRGLAPLPAPESGDDEGGNADETDPGDAPPGGAEGNESSDDRKLWAAARVALSGTLLRMFAVEAKAVLRVIDVADYEAKLMEFWGKHGKTVAAALEPIAPTLALAGSKMPPEEIARGILGESQTVLTLAFASDTKTKLRERLATWAANRTAHALEVILPEIPQ